MQIVYDIKPQDFHDYGRDTASDFTGSNVFSSAIVIMWVMFAIADLIYVFVLGGFALPVGVAAGLFFRSFLGGGAMVATILSLKLISKRYAKKLIAEPPKGMLREHRVVIDENGLTEITDLNTSLYAWQGIGRTKELPHFYFIEITLSGGLMIPKRCFPDPAELERFIETVERLKTNAADKFQLSHLIAYDRRISDGVDGRE